MSIREEVAAATIGPGGTCTVGTWLDAQSPADRVEWLDAFEDPDCQASALFRVMRAHGFPGSDQPVQRHKRGACACGRP